MVWLVIIVLFICLFTTWLLFSPIELDIDTRRACAEFRWLGIGRVIVWFEDEWWLSARVLFYRKTMRFPKKGPGPKKVNKAPVQGRQKGKLKTARMLQKATRMIRTFRVLEWQLTIDTGSHSLNAQLYPLNFSPKTVGHLHVNFNDENFLAVKIRNRPWKLLYAFLR